MSRFRLVLAVSLSAAGVSSLVYSEEIPDLQRASEETRKLDLLSQILRPLAARPAEAKAEKPAR